MSQELLLSKDRAAFLLSISVGTLEGLIARGDLPVRRVGKRVLIPRAALEEFAQRDLEPARR